jgi:hypothetical protein
LFDEQQTRRPGLNLTHPLIVIACAGGGILLSFGLCGTNLAMQRHGVPAYGMPVLARAGITLFALSVLSFIGGLLWLVVAAIINAFRN